MSGQKASGLGKNAPIKRDGYAGGGGPDPIVIGMKPGKLPDKPYTGPNVQKPDRG